MVGAELAVQAETVLHLFYDEVIAFHQATK